jgi:ethanolamine utilization protein EutN
MHLGTVIGRVVATVKSESLEGVKLLIVRPEDDAGARKGPDLIMIDGAGPAGPGDRVWWVEGREAALALVDSYAPVDAGIVAVVDAVDVEERMKLPGRQHGAGGARRSTASGRRS